MLWTDNRGGLARLFCAAIKEIWKRRADLLLHVVSAVFIVFAELDSSPLLMPDLFSLLCPLPFYLHLPHLLWAQADNGLAYLSVLVFLGNVIKYSSSSKWATCQVCSLTCTCCAHFIKYALILTCGLGTAWYPTMLFTLVNTCQKCQLTSPYLHTWNWENSFFCVPP